MRERKGKKAGEGEIKKGEEGGTGRRAWVITSLPPRAVALGFHTRHIVAQIFFIYIYFFLYSIL